MKSELVITTETIPNVLTELEDAFFDIPFENSRFQTERFVIAAQKTPARAYRTLGLQIFNKIQAVKQYLIKSELSKIDQEENEYLMSLPSTSEFEKRRLALKNTEIRESKKWADKLLNDALCDINYLYNEFKRYPKYTREEFEKEEALHFQVDLEQQVRLPNGAADSLTNMSLNHLKLQEMINNPEETQKLIENLNTQFESLRLKQEVKSEPA
jgi:hypothetical protein